MKPAYIHKIVEELTALGWERGYIAFFTGYSRKHIQYIVSALRTRSRP